MPASSPTVSVFDASVCARTEAALARWLFPSEETMRHFTRRCMRVDLGRLLSFGVSVVTIFRREGFRSLRFPTSHLNR
ncbi:hypothetical protein HanRHA438_Chr14g0640161 [Helianthus annuus]|nr:hypothetical protein HanRHA438_Chr14g0640161 [Helianthus annuus]